MTGGIAACDAILGDLHTRDAAVPEDGPGVDARDSGLDARRHDAHADASPLEGGPTEEAGEAGDPGNLTGLQAGAPWPMQDRDPNHTCQSPYAGPGSAVHVAWMLHLGGNVTNPPAIAADGTLYMASEGTPSFFAISPSGSIQWMITLPDPGNGGHRTPAIAADGTLYVGTEKALVALYPDGGTKWNYPAPSLSFYGGPSVAPDGTIYASTVGGNIVALNPAGTLLWIYNGAAGTQFYASTTFGKNGSIYAGSNADVVALDSDGGPEWQYPVDAEVFASPSLAHDGTIYAATGQGNVYAFDTTGGLLWSLTTGGDRIFTDIAVAADGTIYFGSFDAKFYATSPDGGVKWTYTTGAAVEATPVVGSDGTVYTASDTGVVYAFSPEGKIVWMQTIAPLDAGTADAGLRMFGGSIDAKGNLYIGTGDGRLIAFSP